MEVEVTMKTVEQKRKEAADRKEAREKLTPQEQLAKLDKKEFAAKKERARLNTLIGGNKQ